MHFLNFLKKTLKEYYSNSPEGASQSNGYQKMTEGDGSL
jgi:hypothetical protein